ncbi:hypothetical protein C8F04DRAFT_1234041 [Mycena alexandri]|uniref:Uncharacterized protein n=1 Tax=Mycena alexandri TaxID=1745969 RepID=A0AAD6SWS8_9AGAR|nr:hypothetical protein C8F04DRAFT_1234041 [Mycena alexandri]
MHLDVDPDKLDECRKHWDLKWQKYRAELPEDSLDHIEGMGKTELRERSSWLQAEFNRIRANVPELSNDTVTLFSRQNDPQIPGGLMFVEELLEKYQADLVSLSKAAKTDLNQPITESALPKFEIPMEQMSDVSRQSESEIHSLSGSRFSQDIFSEPEQATATEVPATEIHPHTSAENANDPLGAPTNVASQSSDISPGHLLRPRINQTQQNPLTVSSSSSHMKNLTALLGIAFFGASITWSTVFSGTRGDLVLISWSACLFIVGAVGAGSASMLVLPQDLVAKYSVARWTVRVLSLLAMAHVLAGMFLLALAIFVLDPAQESPRARAGRAGMQSAGGYAIAVSAVFVGVSGFVWRRHTVRTWYRSH